MIVVESLGNRDLITILALRLIAMNNNRKLNLSYCLLALVSEAHIDDHLGTLFSAIAKVLFWSKLNASSSDPEVLGVLPPR
jgi:hypothetical protein